MSNEYYRAPPSSREYSGGATSQEGTENPRVGGSIPSLATLYAACHTVRHACATHLLEAGYDIRTVQALLGHRAVRTTMRYPQVLNRRGPLVRRPLDRR